MPLKNVAFNEPLGPWGVIPYNLSIRVAIPPVPYPASSRHLTLPQMHQTQSYLRTFAQAVPVTWAALPLDNFLAPPSPPSNQDLC